MRPFLVLQPLLIPTLPSDQDFDQDNPKPLHHLNRYRIEVFQWLSGAAVTSRKARLGPCKSNPARCLSAALLPGVVGHGHRGRGSGRSASNPPGLQASPNRFHSGRLDKARAPW